MLHLINKSPFERNALDSCLRLAKSGSSILLIEDGVYAALAKAAHAEKIIDRMGDFSFYVLGPDVAARGLSDAPLIEGIDVVDYEGFVDMVAEHDATQSWL
ncbi:MAG: sulfurtransferase complex subunit TusB [Gammaproteobacteria bacterium]|jgi:tRNA 2-thiouridine synthesizing protein B|nr:sulfurtransferase complex subunit TusB [Gammaproteobacteria bacterium]MDH3750140.1 sulfurtransferase complex subunit TusB [Gammaproteobacteria bacterium]MDH3806300.1 sulfurtransferase complex subunit TusB [Gammaproteobacteria bacterium]